MEKNKMDKDKIIKILISVIIILLIIIAALLMNPEKCNNSSSAKTETKEKVKLNKTTATFENLEFTDIKIKKDKKDYILTAKVTNKGTQNVPYNQVSFNLKDKNGKEVLSLLAYLGDNFPPNETRNVTSAVEYNLSDAYTFTITKVEDKTGENTENNGSSSSSDDKTQSGSTSISVGNTQN